MTQGSSAPGQTALDALAGEAARTRRFLEGLAPQDWERPTRCPPMTVLEMAAHARRGWARLAELLDAGPVEGEPEKDAATYYRFDRAALSSGVVTRARADAMAFGDPQALLDSWDDLDAIVTRARTVATAAVYRSPLGAVRFGEYVRTRVVEITVHLMDLRDAVGLAPDPGPEALEITGDVLRQLLGTDLRPAVDDVRFALIGTGRAPLDPDERAALGPLADLFPLLA